MPPAFPPVTKDNWHLHDAQEVAREQGVDPQQGLPAIEAGLRAEQRGANEIRSRPGRSLLGQFIDQFKDFMIVVLIGAAVISGFMGSLVDTLAILVIVLLNAVIGFIQIWRANQAMAALRQLAAAQATVLRDGQAQTVAAPELVPGDIVLLEAGNKIPADLRLIEIVQLRVDESALTGESVNVEKHTRVLTGLVHALGDRLNMAFKDTIATHGRGRGLVVATGMTTEPGKVAGLLDQGGDRSTPLQRRLAAFGKRLALAVLLALGARRMVTLNALIRRLPSVETLGSESESLFSLGLGSNRPLLGAVLLTFGLQLATIYVPLLNPIFKTQALSLAELTLCLAASSVVFVAVEFEKLWLRRRHLALASPLA